jgi:CrcB protein
MAPGFTASAENGMAYVWVALGGALGSVARYASTGVAARWLGVGFPYGTLFVNVVGSYAIGVLGTLALASGRALATTDARAFLIVGILGGFTTFSSFSLETLNLARAGNLSGAATNIALSFVLCLAAVWLGYASATAFSR